MKVIFRLLFLFHFSETKTLLMKKIILFLSCFYFTSAFSQNLSKGDKLFGGSLSFSVFNSNNTGPSYYNTGNAGIFPSYAWLVKDNLAFGVRGSVGYSNSITKYDNGDKRKTRSTVTGLGIFLKKYKTLKDRFGIYFDHEVSGFYNVYKETAPFNTDLKK